MYRNLITPGLVFVALSACHSEQSSVTLSDTQRSELQAVYDACAMDAYLKYAAGVARNAPSSSALIEAQAASEGFRSPEGVLFLREKADQHRISIDDLEILMVLQLLGDSGQTDALPILLRFADHENRDVQRNARDAIRRLQTAL